MLDVPSVIPQVRLVPDRASRFEAKLSPVRHCLTYLIQEPSICLTELWVRPS